MSPARSTARLGMKRKNVFAPSGSNVVPWTRFAATVPPLTFAWYQRTEPVLVFPPPHVAAVNSPRLTVCEAQSDSAPPMLEYCACAIARIPSVSAGLAGVGAKVGVAFRPQGDPARGARPRERARENLF